MNHLDSSVGKALDFYMKPVILSSILPWDKNIFSLRQKFHDGHKFQN